ncbi:hypothetical protein RRG08_008942 [Elysia crispata]|uniref:Uncharacterized protein n=1 Tax=Elysia crispata TaxID=231223 RepID=A0AAE1DID3_9GAST|nr:hypothetical protein RRG08_008942 [Elysia crispata]
MRCQNYYFEAQSKAKTKKGSLPEPWKTVGTLEPLRGERKAMDQRSIRVFSKSGRRHTYPHRTADGEGFKLLVSVGSKIPDIQKLVENLDPNLDLVFGRVVPFTGLEASAEFAMQGLSTDHVQATASLELDDPRSGTGDTSSCPPHIINYIDHYLAFSQINYLGGLSCDELAHMIGISNAWLGLSQDLCLGVAANHLHSLLRLELGSRWNSDPPGMTTRPSRSTPRGLLSVRLGLRASISSTDTRALGFWLGCTEGVCVQNITERGSKRVTSWDQA